MAKTSKAKDPAAIIAAECTSVRLRMLNRVVTRVYDEALRPRGIKSSQLNVLVAVSRLGAVRPKDLAERLHLERSTVSRNVDRMVESGWLTIGRGDDDGRSHTVSITSSGKSLIRETLPDWRRAQRATEKLLGMDAVRGLHTAADGLNKLT
ncbi:MAG: DNA-binding MarR family transcriptional regulator [Pseudohongiellaceae bacterium]|jgi:DNA-binding MarR family transcriptional regulator